MRHQVQSAFYVDQILSAAVRKGHLIRDRHLWKFGRRRFNAKAVNRLIARGEAMRVRDTVIRIAS